MGCGPSTPSRGADQQPNQPAQIQPASSQQGQRQTGNQQARNNQQRQQRPIQNISGPSGGPILVPPLQRGPDGRPIRDEEMQLSGTQLHQALHLVAQYLHQKKQSANIVAVGGAVNTILLHTRETTHDLDFFHQDYRSPELELLNEAGQYAISHSQVPLGRNWLNNNTILYVPKALQTSLAREAVQQNEIVFREPGLIVYAAPWDYAFSAKLDRMHKPHRRPYDIDDATIYLRRYIEKYRVSGVNINDVKEWATRYGTRATDAIVLEVDVYYHSHYRHGGIRW